eukprot:TRINITY_DN37270_c0_g1_i1.p1 TRINITY_DN37270_c0_g1~~TRINITY_DN37270_c0_g1_i1.p1  ORF type:complete len:214 (+),score=30.61 TRINITY_DN37270_c0_g1_i1:143-784(+)
MTTDGWVGTMQVNHFGHALLTKLLLPAMKGGSHKPRVVSTGSANCYGPFPDSVGNLVPVTTDPNTILSWSKNSSALNPVIGYYSLSKFLISQWTTELAHRHPDLVAFSVNPGVSGLGRPCPPMIKVRPCPLTFAEAASGVVFSAMVRGSVVDQVSGALIDYKTEIKQEPQWDFVQSGPSCVPRSLPAWLGPEKATDWTDADRSAWYDAVEALF